MSGLQRPARPRLAARSAAASVARQRRVLRRAARTCSTPEPPAFAAAHFGPKGKVYDGWETRRRREPGHDWAIVRLGAPGHRARRRRRHRVLHRQLPAVRVGRGAAASTATRRPAELADADWTPLVPRVAAARRHRERLRRSTRRTRGSPTCGSPIYPDGGVARLRVHGEVGARPAAARRRPVDLAALENGGRVAGCSDMFYGSPPTCIAPGLARAMGEGWETARRRDDGNDWVLVRLAAPGVIRLAELDTSHFMGNAPGEARLRGCDARPPTPDEPADWFELLPRTRAAAGHPAPLPRSPTRRPVTARPAGRLPGRRHGPAAAVGDADRGGPVPAGADLVRHAPGRAGGRGAGGGRGPAAEAPPPSTPGPPSAPARSRRRRRPPGRPAAR